MTEFEEKRELYNKVQNNEIKLENLNDKGKKAYLTYGIDSGLIDKSKIDNDILKKYNLTDTITYNGVEYKKINKNEITPLMTQEQIKEKNNALTNFGNLGAKYNIPTDKVASLAGSLYAGTVGTLNNIGTNINAMVNNLTPQEVLELKQASEKYHGITAARDYASTVAGDNTTMNFANQVAEGVGGMLPSMLVGGVGKLGGKALGLGAKGISRLGQAGYLGTMGASVQGATTNELLANGDAKSLWEAELKSLPYTLASVGVEQLGGIGKESISKIANNLIRTFGEEAYEESLEGIIDRTLDIMIQQNKLKKQDVNTAKEKLKYVLDPKTIAEEALLGGTTALALGGSAKLTNMGNKIAQADENYIFNQNVNEVLNRAKPLMETTDLAEQTKTKLDTKKATVKNLDVHFNSEKQGIELKFNEKPSQEIIDAIKEEGFKWNNKEKVWYIKESEENLIFANALQEELNKNNFVESKDVSKLFKNKDFSEQVDEYFSKKLPTSEMLYLGKVPDIYKQIGLNAEDIFMKQKVLKKISKQNENINSHEHNLSIDTIKQLPEAISKPLNLIKSKNKNGDDVIVVITGLEDSNERMVLASIEVNSTGQIGNVEFLGNEVTSAYGKRDYEEYMKREIAKGNLLYDVDEGIKNELPTHTVQSGKGINSTNSIPQTNQNMQVQNENTKLPIDLNAQMFSGKSDWEMAKDIIQEGQGNERLKSFYETANESDMLNDKVKRQLAIKRASDGTYYQKSMEQTKNEANEFIHALEARDEHAQYEKAVDLIKRNKLTNTGIESAILTEAVNYFQNQGDYERASRVIEDIEELTQKSGRNIQYLNAWRSLQPQGKWRFVKRAVEKYNDTNTGKNKPIILTEEDEINFVTNLTNFEKKLENNINKAKQELIDNGYFNNVLEEISSQMVLDNMALSNEELKDAYTKEEMMKIFGRGDSSTFKKISTYQTISYLLNTSTFARNFISNVAFKNLEKIAQKFNKIILGDYSVVDLKLNNQGQLAVKEAKSKATKKTTLDILLGIEGIDNTRHTKTTSGTVKNALPSFKNKVLNTAEKGLALELKVPDERTKADVRETIIQQFKQAMGEKGYKKYQKEIEEYANEESKYVTFQDDTALSKLMKNLKETLNNGSEFGIGDFLVKFTQVPANVVSRAIEFSPLGALKAVVGTYDIQNKVRKGEMSIVEANKRATKLGRGLTGTTLMALGILLSKYGILTSNKDEDEEIKNLLKDAGITDGNINISQLKRLFNGTYDGKDIKDGDIIFTIDWLQPSSMIINNGAILYRDLFEIKNGGNALWDIAENTLDLPSNQSLSTILKAVQYKSKDQSAGEAITYGVGQALGDSIAGTLVPSFIRHWSNAIDPVSRNVYANKSDKGTFSQYLAQPIKKTIKNIPYASKTLEPNITAEGKEKKYFDKGTFLNYLIQSSPLRVTEVDMLEGTNTLKDVMTLSDGTTISTKSNMPLRYAPNRTQYTKDDNGEYIPLTDKQKTKYMQAYSEYYKTNYVQYLGTLNPNATDKQKEIYAERMAKLNKYAKQYAERKALEK